MQLYSEPDLLSNSGKQNLFNYFKLRDVEILEFAALINMPKKKKKRTKRKAKPGSIIVSAEQLEALKALGLV